MFVTIKINFRPSEFIAVYQFVVRAPFMPCPYLVYIRAVNR